MSKDRERNYEYGKERKGESEGGMKNGYGSKKKTAPRETNWK